MDVISEVECWKAELELVLARVGGRFGRADLRWRMRDYVRGTLAPGGRKNGWQLAEWAGHRDPAGLPFATTCGTTPLSGSVRAGY